VESALLCAANHALLTPISFLERAALVYPDRHTVVSATSDAPPRTWRETRDHCFHLAAALAGLGIQRRDVVHILTFTPVARPLPCEAAYQLIFFSFPSSSHTCVVV
jgi:non-ribosomal peptide synthetase component E (peptide arylation enzyme)